MAFRKTKLQRSNVWCGICDTAWHHHSLRTILAARHEMHSICWTWIMVFRIQWLNWFTWSHWNTVGHLSRCSFFSCSLTCKSWDFVHLFQYGIPISRNNNKLYAIFWAIWALSTEQHQEWSIQNLCVLLFGVTYWQ